MGLDIDRGTAEQQVEGQQQGEEALAASPGHDHQDGTHAHVGGGESGSRTFAHLLRVLHQVVEEALGIARTREQLLVVVEVVADGGEVTL